MFTYELEVASSLARQASELVLQFYAEKILAEEKIGPDNFSEPVTAADRAASQLIVSGLRKAFPNDAILSEEEPDDVSSRLASQRVWIIDPIDGTSGFIEKSGDFAIQIGLAVGGRAEVGVVLLPAHDTLYAACRGGGTFCSVSGEEPRRIFVSEKSKLSTAVMAVSRHHATPRIFKIMDQFGITERVDRGSVGLKVGLIAERVCDVYLNLSPRTKFWDTCGPQVILEEAGGRMTDAFGGELEYGRADLRNLNGVAASNGLLHDAVIAGLEPFLKEAGRRTGTV